MMGTILLVFSVYLKENHLHKTKSDTNNLDSLNKTLITS